MLLHLVALLSLLATAVHADCGTTWTCVKTATAPTLDANLGEWENVPALTTSLQQALTAVEYPNGEATFRCMYDQTRIYLAMEFPGDYRFSTEDNHLAASVATMMKIGQDATFYNMGGCPDAQAGCLGGVPSTCDAHRVDIGGHWELRTTERGVEYPVSSVAPARKLEETPPAGDDPIANKDDEYAVSPFCRFDDNDAAAGNEWAGAWDHTDPVEGASGTYIFEMSRLLQTASSLTDTQLAAGDTVDFGVAFWDPYETEVTGWTDAGHYVTGCTTEWIQLELAEEGDSSQDSGAFQEESLSLMAIMASAFALWLF